MWLQQPKPVSGEFGGRTSEEAVRLARRELGHEAPVRCWKTRRGGVLGFFAKEAYVAGLAPPAGAIEPVRTARPRPARARPAPKAASGGLEPVSLSNLVEGTSDEVTLGSNSVADAVFSEVLAQAEAAVNGVDDYTAAQSAPHPAAHPAPSVTPSADPPSLVRPERIGGLTESLTALGVPAEYRPDEAAATLDGLAHALARLPGVPPLPNAGGSVIVVVGARRDALVAARHVVADLGLCPSDVVGPDRTDANRQRVARRRSANRVTVLVVAASVRSRDLVAAAAWVQKIGPDYVLGAVPASAKRSDVAQWRAQLEQVDALAVSHLADTATPGELMGELPIALIDGSGASTLRWVLTLLEAKLGRGL